VGEKTAVELLRTYGTLDAILAHAGEVPGKRAREALLAHVGDALLSRQLVTIRRDAPVHLDLDALRVSAADTAELERLFVELEFRSLIPKLAELGPHPGPPTVQAPESVAEMERPVRILDDPAQLAAVIAECRTAPLVALDTETSSLDPRRAELIGLSLAVSPDRSWYLPFAHVAPEGPLAGGVAPRNLPPLAGEAMAPLRALLADPLLPKAGHHVKYDWLVLRRAGVELAGVKYDSMLAAFVLDPGRRSFALDELARDRLGRRVRTYGELVGRGRAERTFAEVPLTDAARYCCDDSETVLQLHEALAAELVDHRLQPLLEGVEMPLVPVLADMEWAGCWLTASGSPRCRAHSPGSWRPSSTSCTPRRDRSST
jgi:DNA polymerase-1